MHRRLMLPRKSSASHSNLGKFLRAGGLPPRPRRVDDARRMDRVGVDDPMVKLASEMMREDRGEFVGFFGSDQG